MTRSKRPWAGIEAVAAAARTQPFSVSQISDFCTKHLIFLVHKVLGLKVECGMMDTTQPQQSPSL